MDRKKLIFSNRRKKPILKPKEQVQIKMLITKLHKKSSSPHKSKITNPTKLRP